MTDAELRDAAVAALKATTISYPDWARRVARGQYPDVTKTKWWQAFNYLEQIAAGPPPPLPSSGLLPRDAAARPTWTPARTFTVTTTADFWTRWNALQAGDRVVCQGFAIPGNVGLQKQLVSRAEVIGLTLTGNGARGRHAAWFTTNNVHFYDVDISNPNGRGYTMDDCHNSSMWGWVHDCPAGGAGERSLAGDSFGLDVRLLITGCGDPTYDDAHPENPGTGIHGYYMGGNSYFLRDSVFSLDVQDQHTGAACQVGHHVKNVTLYASGKRCTWPAVSSVAGNTLQFWGGNTSGIRIPYIYGEDNAGRVIEAEPNSNDSNPAGTCVVEYGRGVRCLKALYPGAPYTDRYFLPRAMFDYQDISPL